MKNTLFAILLLLLIVPTAFAQSTEKTVEKIRGVYNAVSQKAAAAETDDDQGEYGDLIMNELVINKRNHQWRAVGIFNETYKFFYKTTGEDLYPETLVLVKTERRVSSRAYTEEYLFNEKGTLLFYFQKAENDDQVPAGRRVYFNLGKAVRIVEDEKKRDKLTVKDAGVVKDILLESGKIAALFKGSIKL